MGMTMQDKCERVIQGLAVCAPGSCGREKCPYYEGPESEAWGNPDGYRCEFDLRQDAIMLLKTSADICSELSGEIQKLNETKLALDGVIAKMSVVTGPRILGLDELGKYEVFWLEVKELNEAEAALYHGAIKYFKVHFIETRSTCPINELQEDRYGIEWRCWDRKPTDEQRRATAWE